MATFYFDSDWSSETTVITGRAKRDGVVLACAVTVPMLRPPWNADFDVRSKWGDIESLAFARICQELRERPDLCRSADVRMLEFAP